MEIIKSIELLQRFIKEHKMDGVFNDIVLPFVEIHKFFIGETILEEAEDQKFFYFLVEGKAKVLPSSVEGQVVLLDFMEPIDIIGDIEYVFNMPNNHSVTAVKDTIMIAIPIDVVKKYMDDNIYFHKFISYIMAKKIMATSNKFAQSMMYPLKVRLAKYLIEHYEDGLNSEIEIKACDTADYFGISSRHLRRILLEFEDEGILERRVGHILILDLERLIDEANV